MSEERPGSAANRKGFYYSEGGFWSPPHTSARSQGNQGRDNQDGDDRTWATRSVAEILEDIVVEEELVSENFRRDMVGKGRLKITDKNTECAFHSTLLLSPKF
jgi:hypothetical protein